MPQRPNILVILADQLRRSALGCYGDPNISTPHIDELARQSVRFANACSTYPICVPFRFTLMTGEYAHTRFVPAIEWRMSPCERTLADEFNDAEYDTIYCGKWHLYGGHGLLPGHSARKANRTPVPPAHQGRWKKWMGFDVANNPFETCWFEDDDPTPRKLDGYQTDGLFDLTMNHLKARTSEPPFFCILSVEPPHFPLEAPESFSNVWKNREVQLPLNFLCRDTHPAPGPKIEPAQRDAAIDSLRMYYAMIENLDWNVGRMREFLQAAGLANNTIVVFASDHGQMDGAHSELSILKDHPFEESIGIPLIVYDPRLPETVNRIITDPVCTEDLFPTLLGLAGLLPQTPKPGQNIAPVIRGQESALSREGVLLEFVHDLRNAPEFCPYHGTYWRGFRSRRYKYTVLGDATSGGTPWQLFDLEEDPFELTNLIDAPEFRDTARSLHQMMRERMISTGDHYVLASAWGLAGLNLWDKKPDRP
jgi:arylsulfatase A-like enzyme